MKYCNGTKLNAFKNKITKYNLRNNKPSSTKLSFEHSNFNINMPYFEMDSNIDSPDHGEIEENTEHKNIAIKEKLNNIRHQSISGICTNLNDLEVIRQTFDANRTRTIHDVTILDYSKKSHKSDTYIINYNTIYKMDTQIDIDQISELATKLLINHLKLFCDSTTDIFCASQPRLLNHNNVLCNILYAKFRFNRYEHNNADTLIKLLNYLNSNINLAEIIFNFQELANQKYLYNERSNQQYFDNSDYFKVGKSNTLKDEVVNSHSNLNEIFAINESRKIYFKGFSPIINNNKLNIPNFLLNQDNMYSLDDIFLICKANIGLIEKPLMEYIKNELSQSIILQKSLSYISKFSNNHIIDESANTFVFKFDQQMTNFINQHGWLSYVLQQSLIEQLVKNQ